MKKATSVFTILTILAIMCTLVLTACGDNNNEPHTEVSYRAMRDVELGVTITLGDTSAQVEAALGRAINTVSGRTVFENGMEITFIGGRATAIEGVNPLDSGRFEIYGFRIGMQAEEIAETFFRHHELSDGFSELADGPVYFFTRFFDASGNNMGDLQAGRPDGADVANFIDLWNTSLEQSIRLTVIDFTNTPLLS